MSYRVVVVADHKESAQLAVYLQRKNPCIEAQVVSTLPEVDAALHGRAHETRLISFCSSVIIPGRILEALGPVPYNVHPASPDFPGSHPDAFAILAGVDMYGATAHEMVRKVDAGAIVDVELFPVIPSATAEILRDMAFVAAVSLYARLADHCAVSAEALPHRPDVTWGARKTTRQDYRDLCASPLPADPTARLRLERACGNDLVGPEPALAG